MAQHFKFPLISTAVFVSLLMLTFSFATGGTTQTNAEIDLARVQRLDQFNQATQSAQELQNDPRATPTRTPTPINVGNFVWDDLDKDGRQDGGEPGLSGVTVQLWNFSKTQLLDSATTNASGLYTLIAPLPGNYRVRVLLPGAGDMFTVKDAAGSTDQIDSDVNPTGLNYGFTDIYNFASNLISITTIDTGIVKFRTPTPTRTPTPINIGNFVWNDYSGDGYQDAGEDGLVGITVQLWNSAKTDLIDQTVTNASGLYTVVAPIPGDYRVRVLLPTGASFALKDQGAETLDSDINPSGVNFGFTDVITIASNVISTTVIDAGLVNVPATPTPTLTSTPSKTPTITPTATAVNLTTEETIALFSKKLRLFSLIDTLEDAPPPSSFNIFASSAPEKGKFVMGDWDTDGQKTPGLFKEQTFWYTNQIGSNATWSEVTIGDYGKVAVVAGRFNASFANDCFGVIQLENLPAGHTFALYYTCELDSQNPPSGIMSQWIDVNLNGTGKYQFVAGDWNGDGLDSIAVRRDKKIKWGNIAPANGAPNFSLIQKFKTPNLSYGQLIGGDWNADQIDTFGLYFKGDGAFYRRDDLDKEKLTPTLQSLGLSVGKAFAGSWKKPELLRDTDTLLPLPDAALDWAATPVTNGELVPIPGAPPSQ